MTRLAGQEVLSSESSIRDTQLLVAPSRDYSFLTIRETVSEMEKSECQMRTRPLLQFIADWNWLSHRRSEMLEEPPDGTAELFLRAAAASVVHALCDRDGIELPTWADGLHSGKEVTLLGDPITTPFRERVKSKAPEVCQEHGVYFEAEEILLPQQRN